MAIARGIPANGMLDGAKTASMQTANYMTDCCIEEDVIRDVVTDLKSCMHLILKGDIKEIPCNGQYMGGVNNTYVENFIMAFCSSKRNHFDRLQKELIPMDLIRLIILKGCPRDCREEFLQVIMSKSWKDLDDAFVMKVGNQEDFPQMLQTY